MYLHLESSSVPITLDPHLLLQSFLFLCALVLLYSLRNSDSCMVPEYPAPYHWDFPLSCFKYLFFPYKYLYGIAHINLVIHGLCIALIMLLFSVGVSGMHELYLFDVFLLTIFAPFFSNTHILIIPFFMLLYFLSRNFKIYGMPVSCWVQKNKPLKTVIITLCLVLLLSHISASSECYLASA